MRPITLSRLPKATRENLLACGYDTVQDLLGTSTDTLANDLGISVDAAEAILHQVQKPATQGSGAPFGQSVAAMISHIRKVSTRWPELDKLLQGGLTPGTILEISGPPGSPKEDVAIDITASFLEAGGSAIFVDCQNMVLPSRIHSRLSASNVPMASLHYTTILNATEMMVFLYSIPERIKAMPKTPLLILNSLSFLFSSLLNPRTKASILEQVKQILLKASFTNNMTVVITSQMANKMLKEDGSYGTSEEGGKVFMVPQLGSSYLPLARSQRVILSLESPVSGSMYLIPIQGSREEIKRENYSVQ